MRYESPPETSSEKINRLSWELIDFIGKAFPKGEAKIEVNLFGVSKFTVGHRISEEREDE